MPWIHPKMIRLLARSVAKFTMALALWRFRMVARWAIIRRRLGFTAKPPGCYERKGRGALAWSILTRWLRKEALRRALRFVRK